MSGRRVPGKKTKPLFTASPKKPQVFTPYLQPFGIPFFGYGVPGKDA